MQKNTNCPYSISGNKNLQGVVIVLFDSYLYFISVMQNIASAGCALAGYICTANFYMFYQPFIMGQNLHVQHILNVFSSFLKKAIFYESRIKKQKLRNFVLSSFFDCAIKFDSKLNCIRPSKFTGRKT